MRSMNRTHPLIMQVSSMHTDVTLSVASFIVWMHWELRELRMRQRRRHYRVSHSFTVVS